MKKLIRNGQALTLSASKVVRNGAIAATGFAVANSANAAIDVAGVNTALTAAESSAHSVGTVVIGIVAGLTVIGIVIGLARKL